MFNKRSFVLGIILALMAVLATPASANQLESATATANCQGFTLTASAENLAVGETYTVDYNFVLTCNGATPVNVPGSFTFKATARKMVVSTSGTFPGLAGSCVVTGTAELIDKHPKTIAIVINGVAQAPLSCSLPTATCAVIVAEQGVPITPVTLTGSGGAGPPYTFTATGLPPGLSISSGGTISGTPTASGTFNYTVTITDVDGNKGTINCSVTVAPPLSVICQAVNTGDVGVPFNSGPMTVTGGVPPYTFSIIGTLPAGLTLNTSTGAVTGTPTASGTFTVEVTDAAGATSTNCKITINPALSVTCQAVNTGDVGVPFNSGPMTVTGGTPPYVFSIGSGTLPAGLTLNTSTGAVTGTPTAAGSFTVIVTDALGNVGKGCVITINPALSVTCQAVNTGDVGVPFNSGPMTVTGGTPPYVFSIGSGTLPAGLTLNTSTGAVTGTPTAAGSFTIKVTDSLGATGTGCTITINPALSVTCSATNTGEVGVAFNSGPITVTGGTPPYTFSIGSGTLPAGLTLNTTNGAVTGTPTAAGTFTIKVTDSLGATGTGCTITINPVLSVTCSQTNTGDVGVPFNSGPITVTGGVPPYVFSIGSGTLPAGLTLNTSTGAVTGTPTAPGTFTIKVTDALGATGGNCSITINGPLQVSCSSTTSGTVGQSFNSGPITVTGGIPPYVFFIASGSLPAGLSLNTSTGAVTGTPTATGSFTIGVKDSDGSIASTTCAITIGLPACLTADLGAAGGYSILGMTNAAVQIDSNVTVNGNIGLDTGSWLDIQDGATMNGTLFADPGANIEGGSGYFFKGGVVTESMSAAQTAALNAYNTIVSLTPTQTFGNISSATTIKGNGGANIIQVNGSINLSSGNNLILSGGANDSFVINITGGLSLNVASIQVTGGVQQGAVIINMEGSGSAVTLQNSNTVGVIMALYRNININGGSVSYNSEFITGGTITIQQCNGGVVLNAIPACSGEQLTLTCPANSGLVGTPYNSALVAAGGVSPYSYSITSGSLPSGLSLNSGNGDISGTPTAADPYSFTAKVVDSSGLPQGTAAASCSINVTPTAYVCTIQPSGAQCGGNDINFSSFQAQGNQSVLWVNANIGSVTGVSTSSVTTVQFTNVNMTLNRVTYPLPDGFLIFNPSAPQTPTTTFNSSYGANGAWITTVNPSSLSNQLFFTGQAIPVDSNMQGGGQAAFNFTTESTDSNFAFSWEWAAAAYSAWPGNNQANILPYEGNLQAGSPQNQQVQQDLINGPDDGGRCGHNNYTGTFSGNEQATCQVCQPTPITPYIQVDNQSWQQTNNVTVNGCGLQVNLGPQPLNGGSWSWTGPNGYTSTSRQINNIPLSNGNNVYVATYTNSGGCQSQETFTITVQ